MSMVSMVSIVVEVLVIDGQSDGRARVQADGQKNLLIANDINVAKLEHGTMMGRGVGVGFGGDWDPRLPWNMRGPLGINPLHQNCIVNFYIFNFFQFFYI